MPARRHLVLPLLGALLAVPLTASPAQALTVHGHRCTVVGTARADHLRGTSHADVICGLGGDDRIDGRGGDDLIYGGPGEDRIDGGAGNDRIPSGDGDDRVDGGAGADRVDGGAGTDRLVGAAGDDVLAGGSGDDRVIGGAGGDRLSGGSGDDTELAGSGADRLAGDAGDDRLLGGPGQDVVAGGRGADLLDGGSGADVIARDRTADRVVKDADDDVRVSTDPCVPEDGGSLPRACFPVFTVPTATEIELSRTSVDAAESAQSVHVRLRVEHGTGSVARVLLGAQRIGVGGGVSRISGELTRSSGTAQDGVWEGDVVFPARSAAGRYALLMTSYDAKGAGRGATLFSGPRTVLRGPVTIEQTGAGDTGAPVPRSLELDRPSVDTSTGPQTVHARLRVTDDLLGTTAVRISGVWRAADRRIQPQFLGAELHLGSGTPRDGIWEGDLSLPRYAAQGAYRFDVTTFDANGVGGYTLDTLAGFTGSTALQQTGPGDAAPPTIASLALSAERIDTAAGPTTVHVEGRLTDDLSGIAPQVQLNAESPTGSATSCTMTRTAGTATDGTWSCDLAFAAGTPAGAQALRIIWSDQAGNSAKAMLTALPGYSGPTAIQNG